MPNVAGTLQVSIRHRARMLTHRGVGTILTHAFHERRKRLLTRCHWNRKIREAFAVCAALRIWTRGVLCSRSNRGAMQRGPVWIWRMCVRWMRQSGTRVYVPTRVDANNILIMTTTKCKGRQLMHVICGAIERRCIFKEHTWSQLEQCSVSCLRNTLYPCHTSHTPTLHFWNSFIHI